MLSNRYLIKINFNIHNWQTQHMLAAKQNENSIAIIVLYADVLYANKLLLIIEFNFKFLFPCTYTFFFCLNLSLIFQFQVFILESNSYTKQLHRFSELKRFSTRWDIFFLFLWWNLLSPYGILPAIFPAVSRRPTDRWATFVLYLMLLWFHFENLKCLSDLSCCYLKF